MYNYRRELRLHKDYELSKPILEKQNEITPDLGEVKNLQVQKIRHLLAFECFFLKPHGYHKTEPFGFSTLTGGDVETTN